MKLRTLLLPAIVALLLPACATLTNPADLPAPKQPNQFNLDQRLSTRVVKGLLNIRHEYGFLPGRYVAVHEDASGTYYRGPTGAVFMHMEQQPLQYLNGGVWMPHAAGAKPRPYVYVGMAVREPYSVEAAKAPPSPAEGAAAGAAAGAIGGAAGGAAAHGANHNVGSSYGHGAATGAGAGLVAGAIIGAMIAADIGKIQLLDEIEDPLMTANLRDLAWGHGMTKPVASAAAPRPVALTAPPEARPLTAAAAVAVAPQPPSVEKTSIAATAPSQPAPASSGIAAPTVPSGQQTAPAESAMPASPAAPATTRAPAPPVPPQVKKSGPWSYEAANFASGQGCAGNKGAWIMGEHRYGSSRYYVECGDGTARVIACDSRACRTQDTASGQP